MQPSIEDLGQRLVIPGTVRELDCLVHQRSPSSACRRVP
jgi:hypothetical protein